MNGVRISIKGGQQSLKKEVPVDQFRFNTVVYQEGLEDGQGGGRCVKTGRRQGVEDNFFQKNPF